MRLHESLSFVYFGPDNFRGRQNFLHHETGTRSGTFACIEAGMSNPLVSRFSSLADRHLRNRFVGGLYCHSEYLGKKVRDVVDFDWRKVDLIDVVSETKYPEPVA